MDVRSVWRERSLSLHRVSLPFFATLTCLCSYNSQLNASDFMLVRASKGLLVKEVPPFLNVLLKRFDYDTTTWQRVKLNNPVSVPIDFDVAPYMTAPQGQTSYGLVSILIHSGVRLFHLPSFVLLY